MGLNFKSFAILSSNALKIIALIAMTIDHIGFMIFLDVIFLRCIGRIAFPIFAFFIVEGAKYTRYYGRYFGMMTFLGLLYTLVYYFILKSVYLSIFTTFSFALITIWLYKLILKTKKVILKIGYWILILFIVITISYLDTIIKVDYGCLGILIPLILFIVKKRELQLLSLVILLLVNSFFITKIFPIYVNLCALFSVPLLCLYNEQRGKLKLKYFFYFYYPLHLVILYSIYYFLL